MNQTAIAEIVERPVPGGIRTEKVKCKHLPPIEVPEGLFELHTLAAFVGKRECGMTNAYKPLKLDKSLYPK